MGRIPLKSTYKLAKAAEKGRLQGRLEHDAKGSHKQNLVSLREHIGKAIDRIDPLEAIAILGLAGIIKLLIDIIDRFNQPKSHKKQGRHYINQEILDISESLDRGFNRNFRKGGNNVG